MNWSEIPTSSKPKSGLSILNEYVEETNQLKPLTNQHVRNPYILLVAQSNPDDKEIMIKLVMNLIRS